MVTSLRLKWAVGPAAAHARQLKEAKRKKDERACRHDLPRYGRAKTSALLVDLPFGYASLCAGFEPYVIR